MNLIENFETKNYGHLVLCGQVGSKAYGTDTETSDDDLLGIIVYPQSYYIGTRRTNSPTFKIDKKETINAEMSGFELQFFLNLAIKFNPNVIPLLYLRNQEYYTTLYGGRLLIENRKFFESSYAYRTLIGYAKGQRNSVVNCNTGKLGQKRKDLVKIFGYDVKYASHTIRILRMAREFFTTGELKIYRSLDREELLSIRNGLLTLDEWIKLVDYELELAEKAESLHLLKEHPDFDMINDLCMTLVEEYSADDQGHMFYEAD